VGIALYVAFPWLSVAPDAQEEQKAAKRLLRAMERALKAAGLPQHFNLHSLRHTFCSLLIAQGESPVYVQQQAGHASVEMTVGVYGSWFAMTAPGAMNRLAEGLTGTPVATNPGGGGNIDQAAPAEPLLPTGTYGGGTPTRPSPG
jgi:type II secretory pathway pseudopilin PulG